MENEQNKIAYDFLLAEYKELNNTLHINEERGEKRLEFFVTLSSVILGAVGLFLKELDRFASYLPLLFAIILLLFTGLIVIGYITQQRLRKRNQITDGLKKDITAIRNVFKLAGNIIPAEYSAFAGDGNAAIERNEKKFTSLFHIAFVINCVLAGSVAAVIAFLLGTNEWIIYLVAIGVASGFGYFSYNKLNKLVKCSHAGGLVYKTDEGIKKYLVITSSGNVNKWILPKGHIEKGETAGRAAIREVMEEAGVFATLEKELAVQDFHKTSETVKVKYFLMQYMHDVDTTEKRKKLWLTKNEAVEKLSFVDAKKLFNYL